LELAKFCIWNKALYDAGTWKTSKSRSEIPEKFRNMVLEKHGEVQPDRSSVK
jgi:hypothetical protein